MTNPSPYRSAADRARGRRLFPLRLELNAAGMALAKGNRQARSEAAGAEAVALAHELAGSGPDPLVPEGVMWSVRGELRSRETFGLPHAGDFRGGLPSPAEYPRKLSR
jgi:hypothetical protein